MSFGEKRLRYSIFFDRRHSVLLIKAYLLTAKLLPVSGPITLKIAQDCSYRSCDRTKLLEQIL